MNIDLLDEINSLTLLKNSIKKIFPIIGTENDVRHITIRSIMARSAKLKNPGRRVR